jgi:hypothetical protein
MDVFKTPPAEYRGAPFWAWNTKLDPEMLKEQIEYFKAMGFGGAHTHPRTGMDTVYLGDEYMACIKACLEKMKQEGMFLYLYDEDRWPSGGAGGLVTKEERFRVKHLLFTSRPYSEDGEPTGDRSSYNFPVRTINGELLAAYDVELNEDNRLLSYRRIGEDEAAKGAKWYAYMESDRPNTWHNLQTYVDTLSKEAIERFVEVTHERYKKTVGEDFGGAVPSIFSDEPTYSYVTCFNHPGEDTDAVFPWTTKLPESMKERCGVDILEKVPELFFEPASGVCPRIRWLFWDHVAELFASSFADTIGAWCNKNNLLFTGHLMWEPTLHTQVIGVAEAMRSYRSFSLPGIDMLGNGYEYTTAKQAQSASRQYGREGMMSEMYGVTNWNFDFRGHKLQGDWQAALGVTLRVHHLSFLSMIGEAKRDYPASISYQSPWFREYPYIEDHYARLNTVLTRGRPVTRVGVIHPIESMWLRWGPTSQTHAEQVRLDQHFSNVTEWLLFGTVDFDFISESQLPSLCPAGGNPLSVGKMSYDAVIVPGCETLRSSTLERLEAFCSGGGRLIFMGGPPEYVDGAPDGRAKRLAGDGRSVCIPFDQLSLMEALTPYRDVAIEIQVSGMMLMRGGVQPHYVYQLREDAGCRWLFVAPGTSTGQRDICMPETIRLKLKGAYGVERYDTLTGGIEPVPADVADGQTCMDLKLYCHDSLLLKLSPSKTADAPKPKQIRKPAAPPAPFAAPKTPYTGRDIELPNLIPVTLHEPNALLLDKAEFALDDEPYQPATELLRADNVLRERLKLPMRYESLVQPWVLPAEPPEHKVRVRFTVQSEVSVDSVSLALEDMDNATIRWNGRELKPGPKGYFVDRGIPVMPIGELISGINTLEITLPFGRRTNLEWCYLLGDFGVRATGKSAVVTAPVRALAFGDISSQGLAFYGGSITYHIPLPEGPEGEKIGIHIPHYRAPVLAVETEGTRRGLIAFAPYSLEIDRPKDNQLDVVMFGSRVNAFGAVHMISDRPRIIHPRAWRSEGDGWSDEYVFEQVGIMSSPVITLM